MGFLTTIRSVFSRKHDNQKMYAAVLSLESGIRGEVIVRSKNDQQRELVETAVNCLQQMWTDDHHRNILNVMVVVDEAYPHLEKMGALQPMSAECLSEYNNSLSALVENIDRVESDQETLTKALEEISETLSNENR